MAQYLDLLLVFLERRKRRRKLELATLARRVPVLHVDAVREEQKRHPHRIFRRARLRPRHRFQPRQSERHSRAAKQSPSTDVLHRLPPPAAWYWNGALR